jgi:ADP-ribose pyrophosphatase YjhB (NUDIX family)
MNDAPPIPAVSVALKRSDRVLLVKRRFAPSRGLYAFPGGRVEPGETLEDAARRELFEETGLQAGPLTQIAELLVGAATGEAPVRFLLHVFSAPHVGGEPVSASDAEEAAFFSLNELRSLPLTGSVGEIAEELLAIS